MVLDPPTGNRARLAEGRARVTYGIKLELFEHAEEQMFWERAPTKLASCRPNPFAESHLLTAGLQRLLSICNMPGLLAIQQLLRE